MVAQSLFIPSIDIDRQNVPGVQSLAVRSLDVEGSHLVLCKAKLFRVIDVVPEECIDLVRVDRTKMIS